MNGLIALQYHGIATIIWIRCGAFRFWGMAYGVRFTMHRFMDKILWLCGQKRLQTTRDCCIYYSVESETYETEARTGDIDCVVYAKRIVKCPLVRICVRACMLASCNTLLRHMDSIEQRALSISCASYIDFNKHTHLTRWCGCHASFVWSQQETMHVSKCSSVAQSLLLSPLSQCGYYYVFGAFFNAIM